MRRAWVCLAYNLVNLVLFATFFKEATTIRSDGPTGLIEVALKSLLSCVAVAFFYVGVISSILACKEGKSGWALWRLGFVPLVLLLFAALGVYEACSDDSGYCRNGQIFLS